MEPAPAGEVDDLPGMNVSYDRRALEAIDDLLRAGKWESWLHARLLERGFELWCEPDAVLDHAKDFGFREFLSQRYHYSRSYAGMRNAELGSEATSLRARSPLIPPLMYARIARSVLARRRHRRGSRWRRR